MIQSNALAGPGSKKFSAAVDRTDRQTGDWLRLIRDRRWSSSQKLELLCCLDTPSQIYQCPVEQLQQFSKAKTCTGDAALSDADSANNSANNLAKQIASDMQWLQHADHTLITIDDSRYPSLLKEIYDPPIALFAKGDLACLQDPKVAMVGSRRPTPAGSKITGHLANGLARMGIVITSGMALGVDGAAHQGALAAGAPTIAVMGCGLDTIYPTRHRLLFGQIAASGCLLSEFPLGYPPTRFSFPLRNRIISGLSLGVVIIEAAERSGTIITARLAIEQNRELMVVPGSALSLQYKGSHRLIQQGAGIITDVDDILATLSTELQSMISRPPGDQLLQENRRSGIDTEDQLLERIGYDSTSIDEIILISGLTAAEVSSMLLMLELKGAIAAADDGGYVRLC